MAAFGAKPVRLHGSAAFFTGGKFYLFKGKMSRAPAFVGRSAVV